MPQVDFVTFNNQIFWALLVFFVLYLVITNFILEKIAILHFVRNALTHHIFTWKEHFRLNFIIFTTLVDLRYWKSLFFFYRQYQVLLLFIYIQYWSLINNIEVNKFLTILFMYQLNALKQTYIFKL